jgi:hypothetical protein
MFDLRPTKTFRAPAAAKREFIFITAATDRRSLEPRDRQLARRPLPARAFG